jgi:tRNA(adenine34) deaminase
MPRLTNEEYMRVALELAKAAGKAGDVPVGAVVVDRDGEIVGRGQNTRETDKNPLGHAEINAIADAAKHLGGWRLVGCDIYVTLEPCPMCAGAIINARINKAFIGALDPKNGAVISKTKLFEGGYTHRPQAVFGISADECQCIIAEIFNTIRERKYMINFIEVTAPGQIKRVAAMAKEIWGDFFPAIIGKATTDYMVERFQSEAAITNQIGNEQYTYYILQKNGNDLGFIGIKPDGERLFLSKAYIYSRYRGKGYFREALRFIIDKAKETGKNAVWLTCNKQSISCKIYEKCGFEKIGEGVKDIGDGFVMDDYYYEFKIR